MLRKVLIEDDSGNIIKVDEINLQGANYAPKDQEWFDIAWINAVEDKLVKESDRETYKFSFL